MTRKSLFVFLGLLLAVSWAVQVLAIYLVRDLNSPAAMPWLIAMMFFPTAAALIYRLGFNKDAFAHIRFWPGNPLYLVLGSLIPAATGLAVLAIVQSAGWGSCDFFDFSGAGADMKKGPWVLGLGMQAWWMFAINVAVTAIIY
jgi:hypothetical protein